jgi:hypothetical protein
VDTLVAHAGAIGVTGPDSTSTTGRRRESMSPTTASSADTEGAEMNDELDHPEDDEVQRDGLAMLGILVLAIVLIVYVGYNVI